MYLDEFSSVSRKRFRHIPPEPHHFCEKLSVYPWTLSFHLTPPWAFYLEPLGFMKPLHKQTDDRRQSEK